MKTHNSTPITATALALRWTVAAVAVLVVAVAGVMIANRTVFSAAHQVKELQRELADGQGAKALGLMQATVPQGDAIALDGEVLKRTQKGVSDFTTEKAEPVKGNEELRTVTARYKVDGVDKQSSYTLRHTGKSWLFFDNWAFEPSTLPSVKIKANTVNEVTVNEQKIPLEAGVSTLPVFYPSVLDASFSTKNFAADTRGVVVTEPAEKPVEISLKTEPTQAFISAINSKVKKYLDGCASQKVLMPSGCPFSYNTSARVDSSTIDWAITRYPSIKVSYYNGSWVLAPLKTSASLTLTEQDLRTGAKEKKTVKDTYSFTAQLTTSTNDVTVVPVAGGQQVAQ
ncbi:hypothetical protein [Glutamicibacter sp. JC586]|uniref:hypothetical protein n=1 Tax=Glutamicibacter sp. JC586 TaxID=2590552 RepID=UPI001359D5CF|nr:hypothetical protein [Glutamicibacter sp. JC586]